MIRRIGRKLLFLFRRERFDGELEEEMRLHLALRAERLRNQLDGEYAARRRFGNPTRLIEASRDVWTWRWLEDALQDLRFATRLFGRRPGFAAIAAITLALGIGTTAAVFSVVDAVLLRPLPYRQPDRLVAIWDRGVREKGLAKIFAPYADYEEWTRRARSFESITAATWAYGPSRIWTGHGAAKELLTIPVSATFFDTLGVQAALGRTFTAEDERHACAVVLSHSFWASSLGADASIVGQSLTLDQRACTVIGVMPGRFSFYPPVAKMWILLGPDFQPPREQATVGIFARLKPGVTREQAQAEVAALSRASHPAGFWHEFEPVMYDLQGEFTFLASRTLRGTLIASFSAVLLVLLIAGLNVANLLLARLAERQRELAVRAAVGSGRARLVRQVLVESLLLSAIGTAGGILVALAAVRYFRYASPIELTVGTEVTVNLPVLLFAIGLGICTTLLFGLIPALSISRIDVMERLKAGGRGAIGGLMRQRTRRIMVALEMGLSFVLLIGAGLLLRSALLMGSEPLGFDPAHLFHIQTTLPAPRYRDAARRIQFYDALLERVDQIPGVSGAALTSRVPPYAVDGGTDALEIQGAAVPEGLERHDTGLNHVSGKFFDVVGMPLHRGRMFDLTDRNGSAPVAIVNEALVREYFPDGDPLGKQVRISRSSRDAMPWLTIVGVVGNLKHTELMNEMSWVETPILYRPFSQAAPQRIEIAVRAPADGGLLEQAIQQQISALDGAVPIGTLQSVESEIGKTLAYPRFRAVVLGFFSLSALLLSAVGLNGVLSQAVAQRTSEFGLRKAIGAQERDLFLLVACQGGGPVVLGMIAGIGGALLFSRLLTGMLYGIQPADPRILALVSAVFVAVAAIAIALPARRAVRVDPMVALRDE
uniref:Permease n=1 Tax=Solibacter usitatus (strain Ellin6076) TaxID=234267 RepID=Q022A5_SOLUE